MSYGPMVYVVRGDDGVYRDRYGRVEIFRSTRSGAWWLTMDGGEASQHVTLTDARQAAWRKIASDAA